jgi:hypothetical protein
LFLFLFTPAQRIASGTPPFASPLLLSPSGLQLTDVPARGSGDETENAVEKAAESSRTRMPSLMEQKLQRRA